ncbi:MAG: hypothetical protein ISR88_06000 [Candidatus Marinimicrobia bacterium]|nr:hypothetical protein [Candidatus Neomarinimicrobiota bacterium]
MLKTKSIQIILLTILFASFTLGQVTISPTSLFVDSQKRFETLLIMNPSPDPQEIKLSWEFGYPKTDEAGDITFIYNDEEKGAVNSAADWIRGFPKNFILEPGARQTIRVTVKAPRGINDGTYWARLKTTSSPMSPPVGSSLDGGVSANITFQFNQITGVFYRHGDLSTGISISSVRGEVKDDKLHIFSNYSKTGNSPFLGTMAVSVFDASGKHVLTEQNLVSIYYNGLRRLDIDAQNLPTGSYEYEVTFSSGRGDIPDADIVSAPTVKARGKFNKL